MSPYPFHLIKQIIFYGSYLVFPFFLLLIHLYYRFPKNLARMGVVALFIMSGVFIYARFIEPKRLFIERTTIYLNQETQQDQTPEIKIALFGDVHRGVYKNSLSLESIVKRVNAENPDMVIIPGDFVYELPKENIGSALSGLRSIQAPVFSVTGNHDVGFPGEDVGAEVTSALEAINIKVIDNKIEKVTLKGKEITLVGLSDLWQGRAEYSLLEKVKPEDFVVVVTHNPDTTFKLSSPEKADLLLAGHTHGDKFVCHSYFVMLFPLTMILIKDCMRQTS